MDVRDLSDFAKELSAKKKGRTKDFLKGRTDFMPNEKKNAVTELMEQGKAKGQAYNKGNHGFFEEVDFDGEQIEKFYDSLESP